jgi:3-isopropylmalate/(R)-2-methylmalate dehydratase small subunit
MDPTTLGAHLFERFVPPVAERITRGTMPLAGRAFGSGSLREQAVTAILARGVTAVVAASFARILFRNAVNLALPAIECEDAWLDVEDGDEISLDIAAGEIRRADGGRWRFPAVEPFVADLLVSGGLEEWTRRRPGR